MPRLSKYAAKAHLVSFYIPFLKREQNITNWINDLSPRETPLLVTSARSIPEGTNNTTDRHLVAVIVSGKTQVSDLIENVLNAVEGTKTFIFYRHKTIERYDLETVKQRLHKLSVDGFLAETAFGLTQEMTVEEERLAIKNFHETLDKTIYRTLRANYRNPEQETTPHG